MDASWQSTKVVEKDFFNGSDIRVFYGSPVHICQLEPTSHAHYFRLGDGIPINLAKLTVRRTCLWKSVKKKIEPDFFFQVRVALQPSRSPFSSSFPSDLYDNHDGLFVNLRSLHHQWISRSGEEVEKVEWKEVEEKRKSDLKKCFIMSWAWAGVEWCG